MVDVKKLRDTMENKNISIQFAAKTLGIDRSSMYRKLQDGSFKIAEAEAIMNLLQLKENEAVSIFFAHKVS